MLKDRVKKHIGKWCNCTRCPLGEHATKHVLYDGSIPARYFFLGEAPGPDENNVGTPFIGKSGKVLRSLLKDVGLTSKDYCITNVLGCFPFDDDNPETFRKPGKEEVAECFPRVIELINLAQPQHIILLGNEAIKYFKNYVIANSLGSLFDRLSIHDLRHPSFIARNGGIGSVEYKRNYLKLKGIIRG